LKVLEVTAQLENLQRRSLALLFLLCYPRLQPILHIVGVGSSRTTINDVKVQKQSHFASNFEHLGEKETPKDHLNPTSVGAAAAL